jgi:hypothetical protein
MPARAADAGETVIELAVRARAIADMTSTEVFGLKSFGERLCWRKLKHISQLPFLSFCHFAFRFPARWLLAEIVSSFVVLLLGPHQRKKILLACNPD